MTLTEKKRLYEVHRYHARLAMDMENAAKRWERSSMAVEERINAAKSCRRTAALHWKFSDAIVAVLPEPKR